MEEFLVEKLVQPNNDRVEFWTQWALENPGEVGKMLALKEQQSEHDSLTGALNRNGFFNRSSAKISELAREGDGFAFIFGDLNGLKIINDRDGHKEGDRFIKAAYNAIHNAIRSEDICARMGGDEFAVLLPKMSQDQACSVVSRINDLLPEGYSISFGVGVWNKTDNLETVIDEADKKMYEAKHSGLGFGERSSGIDLISLD